jgi:hypothetical protein
MDMDLPNLQLSSEEQERFLELYERYKNALARVHHAKLGLISSTNAVAAKWRAVPLGEPDLKNWNHQVVAEAADLLEKQAKSFGDMHQAQVEQATILRALNEIVSLFQAKLKRS